MDNFFLFKTDRRKIEREREREREREKGREEKFLKKSGREAKFSG